FEPDDLYKKLSAALALKLIIYAMSHTLNTHKKFLNDTGLDTYLDSYEQDIRIILERLSGLIERLQSGELGEELFCDLAKEIDIIGTIFTYHHYTSHLLSIFNEMSAFLRMYDFEDVDLSTLEGFDYLVEITKDIHNYLESFFIKRIFSDVYVFEHSLHDSILFMIRRLTKSQNFNSDVEFF
ncbi:MAG: hypothetical protein PHW94_06170, partial [Sulfurimonas sp.]|nr:hypothetical protein [Sulfurimonas sp.]